MYDRAGTWSSRGHNSRSSYGVSPLLGLELGWTWLGLGLGGLGTKGLGLGLDNKTELDNIFLKLLRPACFNIKKAMSVDYTPHHQVIDIDIDP